MKLKGLPEGVKLPTDTSGKAQAEHMPAILRIIQEYHLPLSHAAVMLGLNRAGFNKRVLRYSKDPELLAKALKYEQVLTMLKDKTGLTYMEIGEKTGLAAALVYRVARRNGIKRYKTYAKKCGEALNEDH